MPGLRGRFRVGRSVFSRIALGGSRALLVAGIALLVANCTTNSAVDPKYGVTASPRLLNDGDEIPKGNGRYRVGNPYVVAGVRYVPREDPQYRAEGVASWYGDAFHGRLTANGEIFDMRSITAAHPTLPLPSYVRVTNLSNGRSLVVRVNDRGPFHANRVIDVSSRAADLLGFKHHGTARVKVEYVAPANVKGSDDVQLAATLRHNSPAPPPNQIRVANRDKQKPFVAQNDDEDDDEPTPVIRKRKQNQVASAGDDAWSFRQSGPQQPVNSFQPRGPGNPQPQQGTGFSSNQTVPAAGFAPPSLPGRGLY